MSQPKRRSRRNAPPLASTRERLAFAVLVLFAVVIASALVVPDAPVLDQALPLVGGLLAVVIGFYFQRRT